MPEGFYGGPLTLTRLTIMNAISTDGKYDKELTVRVISSQSVTLEEVLDDEDIIQECKNQNKRLIDLYVASWSLDVRVSPVMMVSHVLGRWRRTLMRARFTRLYMQRTSL